MTDDRQGPPRPKSNVFPFRRSGSAEPLKSFYDLYKPENLGRMSPEGQEFFRENRALAWGLFGDLFPNDEPPWEYVSPGWEPHE